MTTIRSAAAIVVWSVLATVRPVFAADISGQYIAEITTTPTAEPQYARVTLSVNGASVSGTWGERRVSGSLRGTQLELTLSDSTMPAGTLTGAVSGPMLSGRGSLMPSRIRGAGPGGGPGGPGGNDAQAVTWKLTPYTPPAAPKTYDYEPTSFYTTYSARWSPVLRLYPGDQRAE